jgi:hypothetical protein
MTKVDKLNYLGGANLASYYIKAIFKVVYPVEANQRSGEEK